MQMPVDIDIIILSYAKSEYLKGLTIQTIDTLMASEDPDKIKFNVLVIESEKSLQPYQFENSTTIYPKEAFGFNKYLNIGTNATVNKYICLSNNDVIFHKGWATAMLDFIKNLNTDVIVISPFCDKSHVNFKNETQPIKKNFGYYAGYCFLTTRETLKIIGKLDEKISFWFADLDFIELMEKYDIPHYLLPASKVDHLGAQATIQLSQLDRLKFTYYPYIYFQYKWKDKSPLNYALRTIKYCYKYAIYFLKSRIIKEVK